GFHLRIVMRDLQRTWAVKTRQAFPPATCGHEIARSLLLKTCGRTVNFLWSVRHANLFSLTTRRNSTPREVSMRFRRSLRLITDSRRVQLSRSPTQSATTKHDEFLRASIRRTDCRPPLLDRGS